jgi:RNA recognition motif-containing protein
MALELVSGFRVISISLLHSPFIKNLYVKEYVPTQRKKTEDASPERTSQLPSVPLGRTLFVANLIYDCTKDDLENIFSSFGPIEDIILDSPPDRTRQKQRKELLAAMPPTTRAPNILEKVPFAQNGFAYIIFKYSETLKVVLKKATKEDFYGKCERGEKNRYKHTYSRSHGSNERMNNPPFIVVIEE